MSFLNPFAFYLLGVIPIVIALHFLRLRRKRHVVPSMMLWRIGAEDQKANVPFQRLRHLLLPLLQSLFLLIVIISIARPAIRIPGIVQGKIIFIIDNSASMLSKEMGQPRLARAKQEVKKHINSVSASGGVMIMTTHSPKPYIQQVFTTDINKLQRAVENIKPTHATGELTAVFDHANRFLDSSQDQIFFVSDSFENLPATSFPINKIAVGDIADNIGIVQFSVERIGDQYTILAGIQNWTDTKKEIHTQIELEDGTAIADKPVLIQPGEVKSVVFSIKAKGIVGKSISLHLVDVADDFDLDNTVWALLSEVKPFRILLISDRKPSLLIELLRNYGQHAEIQTVSANQYQGTGDSDLVIIDGSIKLENNFLNLSGSESVIFINPQNELPYLEKDSFEIVRTPVSVISEDKTHPIMQDASIMGLEIKETVHRELPQWGRPLVESEIGELVWLGTEGDRQYLIYEFDAFNPEISSFAISIPDGPLFFYKCLEWLESSNELIQPISTYRNRITDTFRPGEQVRINYAVQELVGFQVRKPDGSKVALNSPVFTDTNQIGVYTVFTGESQLGRFAVNLLDETESALLTPKTGSDTQQQAYEEGLLQPIMQEVWQWTALLAVGLLLFEWFIYHRS